MPSPPITPANRPEGSAPCAAAIVFAVAIEADAFERLATDRVETIANGLTIHAGRVAGRRVAWSVAGVGEEPASRAALLLVDGHRPGLLVSAGFAGGLDPALPRGAVVRPARVIHAGSAAAVELAAGQQGVVACTTDRIVRSAGEKQDLRDRTAADVVDMETFAVAQVAADRMLPCAAVRVVSDTALEDLPREVAGLARPQSTLRRLGAAIGAVGRRPGAVIDLWNLWERAVIDGRTLAAALEQLCRTLPA